ncbi:hypothetical protein ACFSOZ_15245 [Mesorhizobium newzealandense]|uniref:Uncharacterized protein n=1 Tax=Mesorhizobium newzealandense TaxID=1300302 RepID=A0ABW4UCU2_9HYPH
MKLPAGHYERQAKAARRSGGSIKPALCESAQAGLEIDARTAQDGQPGGILRRMSSRKTSPPGNGSATALCSATQKIYQAEILCEQALNIDKNCAIFAIFGGLPSISGLF